MSSEKKGMYYRKDNLEDKPQRYDKTRPRMPGLSNASRWSPTRDSGQSGQSSGAMSGRDNAGTSGKPDLFHLMPAAKKAYEEYAQQLNSLNEQKAELDKNLTAKQEDFKDDKYSRRSDKRRLQKDISNLAHRLTEVDNSIRKIESNMKSIL